MIEKLKSKDGRVVKKIEKAFYYLTNSIEKQVIIKKQKDYNVIAKKQLVKHHLFREEISNCIDAIVHFIEDVFEACVKKDHLT